MSTITDGKVVSIQYTLKDSQGEVLDASEPGDPLLYLHGYDNIVPGLEKQLDGRAVGDSLEAVVAAAEGYGERDGTEPEAVPRSAFPPEAPIEPGVGFMVQDPDGKHMELFVVKIEGDQVFVDGNHPLAGQTLHFHVEVLAIRDATEDEQAHGHPHGPTGTEGHGHHH